MFYYKLMHWISNIKYYLLISFCPLSEGLQIFLRQHLYVFVFLCVYNNGLLNVAKPSRKHLCRSLFLNKVASLHHANLLKKKKTPSILCTFSENTSGQLFLDFLVFCRPSVAKKESCIHTFYRLFARIFCRWYVFVFDRSI